MSYKKFSAIVITAVLTGCPSWALDNEKAVSPKNSNAVVKSYRDKSEGETAEVTTLTLEKLNRANELIAKEPLNDRYLAGRGQLYMDLGRNTEALTDLNSAIAINPHSYGYYEVRAAVLGRSHEYSKAVADFDMAIKEGAPPTPLLLIAKASALRLSGDLNEALLTISEAIKLAPNLDVAWGIRAAVKVALRDFKGADSDCAKAQQLKPDKKEWRDLRALLAKEL